MNFPNHLNQPMISEQGREILMQFGSHLRKLRISKDLSYRQMSQQCNVDAANIKKIEKGTINATLLTLHELAKGLEIEPAELMRYNNLQQGKD